MLLKMNIDGTLTLYNPAQVNQGSVGANKLEILAPFASGTAVTVAFKLPNGSTTTPAVATLYSSTPVISEENEWHLWTLTMNAPITQYAGTLGIQAYFTVDNATVASTLLQIQVQKGVAYVQPSGTSADWSSFLALYNACLQAKNNAETAEAGAVDAKNDAVTAKNQAVSAKNDAVQAKDDAVTAKNQAVAAKNELLAQKGQPNGIASLDANGKVPSSQIPGCIIDVEDLASKMDGDEFVSVDENEAGTKVVVSLDSNYKPWMVELEGSSGTVTDDELAKLTVSEKSGVIIGEEYFVKTDVQTDHIVFTHVGRDNQQQIFVKTLYLYTDSTSVLYKTWTCTSTTIGSDDNSVHYTADAGKTSQQKAQARANIEAVQAVAGKGLSTNDLTDALKARILNAQVAKTWENYEAMVTDILALGATDMLAGQSIFIKTTQVPDLWVFGIESFHQPYTYTTDEDFIEQLANDAYVHIGYYLIAPLEGSKVAIDDYLSKSEAFSTYVSYNKNQADITTATEKARARSNIGAGTYSKPNDGIPSSDLTTAVQTSLSKADSAMQNPMTTQGDLIVGGANGAETRLAKGSLGQVLKVGNSGLEYKDNVVEKYTTAPTEANTDGLKFVVLSSEPATKYDGWVYIITGA